MQRLLVLVCTTLLFNPHAFANERCLDSTDWSGLSLVGQKKTREPVLFFQNGLPLVYVSSKFSKIEKGQFIYQSRPDGWGVTKVSRFLGHGFNIENEVVIDTQGQLHMMDWTGVGTVHYYRPNGSNSWTKEPVYGKISRTFAFTLDASNNAHVVLLGPGDQSLFYGSNQTGAWKFELVPNAHAWHHDPGIAVSTNKSVHITFLRDKTFIYAVRDSNGRWSEMPLVTLQQPNNEMKIKTDRLNRPHFLYYTANSAPADVVYATLDSAGKLKSYVLIKNLMYPQSKTFDVDSKGVPHFVYTSSDYKDLMYATLVGDSLSHGVIKKGVANFSAKIAIDPQDNPHVVFLTEAEGDPEYLIMHTSCGVQ